jgi:hypothetical protein
MGAAVLRKAREKEFLGALYMYRKRRRSRVLR